MATIDLSQFAVGGATRPDSFSGLDPAFLASLQQMFQAAPPEIQSHLRVMSGFRSPDRQAQLWQNALAKYGSPEAARKWVAPPGRSQHNHGNAVDLKYLDPAATAWAHENAQKFGLNFPLSNENWHIEPIGARGQHRHPVEGQPQMAGTPAPAQPAPVDIGPRNVAALNDPSPDAPIAIQPPAQQPAGEQSPLGNVFEAMASGMGRGMQPIQDTPAAPVDFGSGDPMGATIAAAQSAQQAKGLAAGLAPDIAALMGMGKRPAAKLG